MALHLDESRFKSYLFQNNVSVNVDEDTRVMVDYIYAMNTNKDETTFELIYRIRGDDNATDGWHPVPPKVLEKLFKNKDGEWNFYDTVSREPAWRSNTKIDVVDGHFMFKYNTRWLRNMLGSISVDSINYSFLGKMVYEMKYNIAIALVHYPNHEYTMEDTNAIRDALRTIAKVSFSISLDEADMSSSKKRMLERLEKAHGDLADFEKKYQEILDKAADAMNLMSSKYGIEVEI